MSVVAVVIVVKMMVAVVTAVVSVCSGVGRDGNCEDDYSRGSSSCRECV